MVIDMPARPRWEEKEVHSSNWLNIYCYRKSPWPFSSFICGVPEASTLPLPVALFDIVCGMDAWVKG